MATILIVDDQPTNRQFFAVILTYDGHSILEACDGREALELLGSETPDLIISDILMPNMDGFTLARRLRINPQLVRVPIIFQTAHYLTEEVRQLAFDCGVQHILSKPIEPFQLLDMVHQVLIRIPEIAKLPEVKEFQQDHLQLLANKLYQKVTELEEANLRLQNLSATDDLTGINNRRGFMVRAEELLTFAKRAGHELSLLYLDLDGLKTINDQFGHATGDQALHDTARILVQTFRASDIIARLGGDEFAVLAIDTTECNAETVQRRLQQNLDIHDAHPHHPYVLSFSLGVIHVDLKSNPTTYKLLAQADEALYVNKQQKKKKASLAFSLV